MKTISINGQDMTKFSTPHKDYRVAYKKISGGSSGYMMDGSYTEDTVSVKAQIVWTLLPMKDAEYQAFLKSIYKNTYATVYYYDPRYGYRTIEAMYELGEAQCVTDLIDGDRWILSPISLTER